MSETKQDIPQVMEYEGKNTDTTSDIDETQTIEVDPRYENNITISTSERRGKTIVKVDISGSLANQPKAFIFRQAFAKARLAVQNGEISVDKIRLGDSRYFVFEITGTNLLLDKYALVLRSGRQPIPRRTSDRSRNNTNTEPPDISRSTTLDVSKIDDVLDGSISGTRGISYNILKKIGNAGISIFFKKGSEGRNIDIDNNEKLPYTISVFDISIKINMGPNGKIIAQKIN